MKYHNIIEDYINGKLKGPELEAFLEMLQSSSELRSELAEYKKAVQFVVSQEEEINSNSSKLKEFEFDPDVYLDINRYNDKLDLTEDELRFVTILKSENEEVIRKRILKGITRKATRAFFLLVMISGLVFSAILTLPRLTYDNLKLYSRFYSAYEPSTSTRSVDENNQDSILKKGLDFYRSGDYRNAVEEFASVPDSLINNYEIFLIQGVSFMELGRYSEALEKLKAINNKTLYYELSLWYQGLCYIRLDDKKKAKETFSKLQDLTPYVKEKSKKLLKYL